MAILLISYSIHEPGHDYPGFERFIKDHKHVKFSESSYAIETNDSPFEVEHQIKPYFDDSVYVVVMHLNISLCDAACAQI